MRTMLKGRRIHNLALPGDEDTVLDLLYKLALRRERRFTLNERAVYMCTQSVLTYGFCIQIDCPWCGGYA
ncbi:hypothetical protein [Streptomyces griseus]|uniref:hypothetical protein n=1 Tax=Streptomyces griseus TaxID=1911 RepID=UPI003410E706